MSPDFSLPRGWYVGSIEQSADPARMDQWRCYFYNDTIPPPNRLLAYGQGRTLPEAWDMAFDNIDRAELKAKPVYKVVNAIPEPSSALSLDQLLAKVLPPARPIRRR